MLTRLEYHKHLINAVHAAHANDLDAFVEAYPLLLDHVKKEPFSPEHDTEWGAITAEVALQMMLLVKSSISNATDVLNYLIEQGVDINLHKQTRVGGIGETQESILSYTLQYHANEATLYLINKGGELHHINAQGRNAINEAIYRRASDDVIVAMLNKGADPDHYTQGQESARELADRFDRDIIKKWAASAKSPVTKIQSPKHSF